MGEGKLGAPPVRERPDSVETAPVRALDPGRHRPPIADGPKGPVAYRMTRIRWVRDSLPTRSR